MNTSLINSDGAGIPVFYACLPAVLFLGTVAPAHIPRKALLCFIAVQALLVVCVALHMLFNVGDPEKELKQLIARTMLFLFFAFATVAFMLPGLAEKAWKMATVALKLSFIYGFYQFAAGFLNLPLFLEFLRNNKSFSFADNSQGGWIDMFRATSIWAEPSFAAVPIALFIFLLTYHPSASKRRKLWYVIVSVYAALTFSRTVWAIWAVCSIMAAFSCYPRRWYSKLEATVARHRYALFLIVPLILVQWTALVKPSEDADISAITRTTSVTVGQRVFFENPWLGTGLNSFGKVSGAAMTYYTDEDLTIVHNMFVSYGQQLGVLGLAICIFPLVFVLSLERVPFAQRLYWAGVYVLLGSLGGDFLYFSLSWFVLALLAAQDAIAGRDQASPRYATFSPRVPSAAGL